MFETFMDAIVKELQNRFPEYDISIHKVMKNNDLELHGLHIMKEDERISPNIYLESFFEEYKKGVPLEQLAEGIMLLYERSRDMDKSGYDMDMSFENVKERLVFRLVGTKHNKRLLKEVPHVLFLDMAVLFYVVMKVDEEGVGSIRVTNAMLEMWNKSVEEIKKLADANTPRLFPPVFQSLQDVLEEYTSVPQKPESGTEKQTKRVAEGLPLDSKEPYITISNTSKVNGASCMLYPDVLEEAAERLQSDLYIIPSSIHEIIVFPYQERFRYDDMVTMITQVNHTLLAYEDILSEHPYIYKWREKTFAYEK